MLEPQVTLEFRLLHVGVAVESLDPAQQLLSSLFGYKVVSGPFDDPIQKVAVTFLTMSDSDAVEIELVAPRDEDSPIRSMLAKGGFATYHLCFETNDMDSALGHARTNRCVIVSGPVPAVAFGGRRVAWIYTRSGQLFELVEALSTAAAGGEREM